jgi:Xaa-Pro aminopeptidase
MHATDAPIFRPALLAFWMAFVLTVAVRADDPPASKAPSEPSAAIVGPSKEEYRKRRQDLMAKIKIAEAGAGRARALMVRSNVGGPGNPAASEIVVVLVGSGEPGEDARFRQENDFWYLTGVEQPHASMILWPDSGEETLYLPPHDKSMDRWIGPRLGPGPDAANATGFAKVESTAGFLADLFRSIGDTGVGGRFGGASVYLLEPTPRADSSTVSARISRFVREGAPSARYKDVAPLVHEMRKKKSEAEAALIRRAVGVTADAQREVIRLIRPGVPEYRLEGAIMGAFVAGGATRAGFPSIVGSGPNSTVLHYEKNSRIIEDGDLVVVDIGGEVKGYTADVTRTYPANGKFTPRQREIYQLVLDAQTLAASEFKPGVSTLGTLTRTVRDFFRKSPIRAKDEAGVEQTMDHFFVHGLGHHMGLDVHDVGDSSKPLQVGEVFTIEPGIYIPGESLGVRIEDDYRVTAEGLEKLSKDITVEADEIEKQISRARNGNGSTTSP